MKGRKGGDNPCELLQFSLYIERCRFLCIFRRVKGRKNIILVDFLLQIQIPVYMLVMTLEFKPALCCYFLQIVFVFEFLEILGGFKCFSFVY